MPLIIQAVNQQGDPAFIHLAPGAFHCGTIAEGSGQPRGDCPYPMGQWVKVKCTPYISPGGLGGQPKG
jgi:hypothetical protein